MDADVQAFADKMAEKAKAKAKVLAAIAAGDWKAVEAQGISGAEGKAMAEAQAIAEAYVAANPAHFVAFEGSVSPQGHEHIVRAIDIFSAAGMEEEVLRLTMFELVRFERQKIGVATMPVVRLPGG